MFKVPKVVGLEEGHFLRRLLSARVILRDTPVGRKPSP
jgi:hypothetical protein